MWTAAEVIDYLNQRQDRFLRETSILMKRETINTLPNVIRHPLPADWAVTERVVFQDEDGVYTEVPRGDGWEMDHGILDWPYNQGSKPLVYTDGEVQSLTFQTAPPANAPGVLEVLYVYTGATLSNTGVALTVPDEFTPPVRWGVVADMLMKLGRAHDPGRAAIAESRFLEGVEIARLILEGWP